MDFLAEFLLAGTARGPSRLRVLRTLVDRPRTATELVDALGCDPGTVQRHLDVLVSNAMVVRGPGGEPVYVPTDDVRASLGTVGE